MFRQDKSWRKNLRRKKQIWEDEKLEEKLKKKKINLGGSGWMRSWRKN